MEITERADSLLELRPTVAVPAGEAWFWDQRWQEGERAVDVFVAQGDLTVTDGAVDFVDSLQVTSADAE